MKKNFQLLAVNFVIMLLVSCNTSTYMVSTLAGDAGNGSACPTPTYIATVSKTAGVYVQETLISTVSETAGVYGQETLTLASLLKDAKAAYGNDVTIQNVRWDVLSDKGTKVSVIYDVIKCK